MRWAFLTILLLLPLVSANDSLLVEVDVTGDVVSIDVPDKVYLGNISRGFKTSEVELKITNKGNTNILITANTLRQDAAIFQDLLLSNSSTDNTFKKVSDFSMPISRPAQFGGIRNVSLYLKMDLSDYTGIIPTGANRLDADIKFLAVAA